MLESDVIIIRKTGDILALTGIFACLYVMEISLHTAVLHHDFNSGKYLLNENCLLLDTLVIFGDIRQFTVLFIKIQTIADDKQIRNFKKRNIRLEIINPF